MAAEVGSQGPLEAGHIHGLEGEDKEGERGIQDHSRFLARVAVGGPLLAPSPPSFLTRTLPTSSLLVCQAMKMEARTTRLALRVRACAVLKARSYVRPYVCAPPSLLGAGPVSHVSASQPDLLHQ